MRVVEQCQKMTVASLYTVWYAILKLQRCFDILLTSFDISFMRLCLHVTRSVTRSTESFIFEVSYRHYKLLCIHFHA